MVNAKYEYKCIIIRPPKKEDGTYDNGAFTTDFIDKVLNEHGLEGWVLRSHTMNFDINPTTVTAMFGRKLDITED